MTQMSSSKGDALVDSSYISYNNKAYGKFCCWIKPAGQATLSNEILKTTRLSYTINSIIL